MPRKKHETAFPASNTLLVLALLEDEDKYGYQIISELRDRSRERFLLKEGTLYPILYRLEEDGLVESRWSGAEGRKVPRKYYHITGEGRRVLAETEALWREICRSVDLIMEEEHDGKEI